MYERKSRLTSRQQGRLIEYFVAGATTRAAAELVSVQLQHGHSVFHALENADCFEAAELLA